MQTAKQDLQINVPWGLLMIMLVFEDMGQNRAIPLLPGDQYGDSYYMCLLIQMIFGIACPAKDFMHLHLGGIGQSTTISCTSSSNWSVARLLFSLMNLVPLKHLVLGADDCPGQNNNKVMAAEC